MTLSSIFLRWVARNSDALVKFVTDLDAKLDEFLLKADDEVAGFEQDIRDIKDDLEDRIKALRAEADTQVNSVQSSIDEKQKAVRILTGVKTALPTGEQ